MLLLLLLRGSLRLTNGYSFSSRQATENGARCIADDLIGMRTQPSKSLLGSSLSNDDQIGVLLQSGFCYCIRDWRCFDAGWELRSRFSLQLRERNVRRIH